MDKTNLDLIFPFDLPDAPLAVVVDKSANLSLMTGASFPALLVL